MMGKTRNALIPQATAPQERWSMEQVRSFGEDNMKGLVVGGSVNVVNSKRNHRNRKPDTGTKRKFKMVAQTLQNNTGTFDIPLNLIVADRKKNSRTVMDDATIDDLADSIKKEKQLTPVKVEQRADGKFDLVFGYRRHAAISRLRADVVSKKKESDEWSTIRCEVVEPMDPTTRKLQNIAENMAREDLTTFDQAVAFLDLKKEHDCSGAKIASHVGKSQQYVNNLMRILESLDETVLKRWQTETQPRAGLDSDGKRIPTYRKICTMDWLTKLATVPKAEQEYEMRVQLGLEDPDDGDDDDGDGNGARQVGSSKRCSMSNLVKAQAAAEEKLTKENEKGEAANAEMVQMYKNVISTLKYCIGKTQSIKGVYTNPKPE